MFKRQQGKINCGVAMRGKEGAQVGVPLNILREAEEPWTELHGKFCFKNKQYSSFSLHWARALTCCQKSKAKKILNIMLFFLTAQGS